MQLAQAIGFNPTHGYKYILRLEKGLVPNPTLRTIAAILDALHSSWQEIADVLPSISAPKPIPQPVPPVVIEPQPHTPAVSTSAGVPRGSRPLREWLRLQRRQNQHERIRLRWEQTAAAIERAEPLIAQLPAARARRAEYLMFIRNTISTLTSISSPQPRLVEAALERDLKQALARELEPDLLRELQRICRETALSRQQ
jgi:transcriptional regulator with XRE-family HTH domain